jgi:restriction endonuclease S subunit
MAIPYLNNKKKWYTTTLEPNPIEGIIISVDSGGTPSTKEEDYWDGNIPWLTPKEITDYEPIFISNTDRKISEIGLKNSSAKLLPAETVMLTKRAPVGAVAVSAIPMCTNQGFLNFQCGEKLKPLYLAYWFRANREYLNAVANGSTYPELYKSDLFEFEISVPPVEEQEKIIEFINSLQFHIFLGKPLEQSIINSKDVISLQEQNARLIKLRDMILPLVMSGEIEVSELTTNMI